MPAMRIRVREVADHVAEVHAIPREDVGKARGGLTMALDMDNGYINHSKYRLADGTEIIGKISQGPREFAW